MDIPLRRGGAADLDLLQPLWLSMHAHHQQVAPDLAPYVSDQHSWAVRRGHYVELLAKPGTVLWLATQESGHLVGYCLAHTFPAEGSWADDTWITEQRLGEVESLAVLPEHRNQGLGGKLLTTTLASLKEAGINDFVLGHVVANTAAHRFYQRHGFQPTWMYLARWQNR